MRPIHTTSLALLLVAAPLSAQTDWSTYFGAAGDEWLLDLQTDAAGRVYVCGQTDGTMPVTPGALQLTRSGATDAFVACLDRSLPPAQQLLWGTYLGGTGDELATELHVNADGTRVTVVGYTTSANYPSTTGATYAGDRDAFVTVLDPTAIGAAQLRWSTLLGGSAEDMATGLDVQNGRVAVVGTTMSTNFPTLRAAQPLPGGALDLFVANLLPGGTVDFATYLGGSSGDGTNPWNGTSGFSFKRARAALDDQGRTIVASHTFSSNFPTTNGASYGPRGNRDICVTRFESTGQLLNSSVLGGTGGESLLDLRDDGADRVVLSGSSGSFAFPTTANAYQTFRGNVDAVVVHLDLAQNTLLYSTFLGGSAQEFALSAFREPSGTFVIGGHSGSSNFPITPGAPQPQRLVPSSNVQTFLARLRPGARSSELQFSTWFGGSNQQTVVSIEPDGQGGVLAGGPTISSNFPTTVNAYDRALDSVRDGWIAVHRMLPQGVQRFGQASSPCGEPTFLQVNGAPLGGNASWAVETHGAPAGGSGALFVAPPFAAGFPVLGIDLYVGLPAWLGVTQSADASGFASVNLPLPAGFTWDGATAFQSVWLNPAPCAGELLTASNALR